MTTARAEHSTPGTRRLRLGIDARSLVWQRTGVERFAFHVTDQLARLTHEVQCVLFVDRPVSGDPWEQWDCEVVVVPPRWRLLRPLFDFWLTLQLRPHLRAARLDAFFVPYNKLPLSDLPCFCALHGLEWLREPGSYRKSELVRQWLWFHLATRWADGLITFAEYTAQEVRRLRPGFSRPLLVVPEGVAPPIRHLRPDDRSTDVLTRLGVRPPFVLAVCSLEPRKNIDGLLRAYAQVVVEHDVREQLVLVGRAGLRSRRLHQLVDKLGLTDRVVFTGYVSDEDLVQLYNQAKVFVYPSKCEGFGLPVIEAMACGTPVVTSDDSALREVAGDAAVLIDPYSIDSLAAGLAGLLRDADACRALRAAGLRRAEQFDWRITAQTILTFIRQQIGWAPCPEAAHAAPAPALGA